MTSIHEIFSTFGPEYLQRYATTMPRTHRKVIDAIIACRTEACGIAFYQCESCAEPQQFFRSCGNRHCPTCQYNKTQQWLQTQIQRQLPGHHFLITFTVPEQLRSFMRQNQRVGYSALFKASSDGHQKTRPRSKTHRCRSPRLLRCAAHLGTNLQYHPHIHYIVSGGAIRSSDGSWHPSRIDFFLPVKALSKIFRAKFRDLMKQAKLFDQIPTEVWQIDWNVNCQAVSSSEAMPQIPRSLRLQSRHLQLAHRQRPGPHRADSLSQASQPALQNPCLSMSWSSSAASCSMCCPPVS